MRRLAIMAGMAVALSALAGCGWFVRTDPVAGEVTADVLAKVGLEYYWQSVRLPMDAADGETISRLWRLDENVYALTTQNRLIAVDAITGRLKWSYPVAKPAVRVFAPCHADAVILDRKEALEVIDGKRRDPKMKTVDAVVVNTLSRALIINRSNGEIVRKLDLGFVANSPGASDGNFFYVGAINGRYHAVRLCDGIIEWTRATGDMISAAPVWRRGQLAVASQDGDLYMIQPKTMSQKRLWVQPTEGPLTAGFVVDDRGCFVPSQDYKLYAFDVATGRELWTPFRTQGPLRQAVQVGQRSAFQYAENDRFYAVDIGSGRKRWEMPEGRMVLGASGQYVFVLNDKNRLLKVQESLGRTEVEVPLNGLGVFVPNAAGDAIYAATADGRVVCLRPLDAGQLTLKTLPS